MTIYISINGVLRDFWNKLLVEYQKFYLEAEAEETETFHYQIHQAPAGTVAGKCAFQSEEEMLHFLYVNFPMEIFGHASPVYKNVMLDVTRYALQEDARVYLVSKEIGKSIPATFFFLAKTTCLCNHLHFYQSDAALPSLWENCDCWITDDAAILQSKPEGKKAIKVIKDYNTSAPADQEINQLSDLIHPDDQKQKDSTPACG